MVLQVLRNDDSVDREVILTEEVLEIGRDDASGFPCPDDGQMAACHARLTSASDVVTIADSGEGSGVWMRLRGPDGRVVSDGDQIWVGAQILVIVHDEGAWRAEHYGADGQLRATHTIPAGGVFVGRQSDLMLDARDTRLSRRHAQFVVEDGALQIYDRGAHNGTFVRLREPETLSDGDEFQLAAHRFRVVARACEPVVADLPESSGELGGFDSENTENLAALEGAAPALGGSDASLTSEPTPEASADSTPESESRPEVKAEARKGRGLASRLRGLASPKPRAENPEKAAAVEADDRAPREPEPERSAAEGADPARSQIEVDTAVLEEPTLVSQALFDSTSDAPSLEVDGADEASDEASEIDRPEPPETSAPSPAESDPSLGFDEPTMISQPLDPEPLEAGGADGEDRAVGAGERAVVVIESDGGAVEVGIALGKTILEGIEEAGLEGEAGLDWECRDGGCGICVLSIVEGAECLDPPDVASGEMKTIQITEEVVPDPTKYRLACLARVRGPLRVRRLS